jgi:diacylglycerol kinase family enzyme
MEKKEQKGCHVCKQNLPYKDPPPSGICSKCQHKIAVVVNPYSGNGRTARKWPELAALIENQIGPFIYLETRKQGDATNLVRQTLREGYDRIISVGGDGTILRTCLKLPKPEPPILAINMGVRGS